MGFSGTTVGSERRPSVLARMMVREHEQPIVCQRTMTLAQYAPKLSGKLMRIRILDFVQVASTDHILVV
jgi:hypothetical protein